MQRDSCRVSEPELSIVTPLFFSAPYLREFYDRICSSAGEITSNFEIILVNDGSPDKSLEIALSLFEIDPRLRVIDLSRNFGQHKAIMTGLSHARGSQIFLIDCDLEIAPEVILQFNEKMKETGADVIYGVQDSRNDRYIDRFAGKLFYTIFNLLSTDRLPVNLVTSRLMSQHYVASLIKHKEREVLIGGLWIITGFNQVPLVVCKTNKGSSTYSWGKRISILVNAITSFSNKPLVLIFYLGIVISFLSGLAALVLIIRRLFFGVFLEGWPSLIVSMWLLGGMMIFCLGVIGIYLSKIFIETKQRPYTIIKHLYERSDAKTNEV